MSQKTNPTSLRLQRNNQNFPLASFSDFFCTENYHYHFEIENYITVFLNQTQYSKAFFSSKNGYRNVFIWLFLQDSRVDKILKKIVFKHDLGYKRKKKKIVYLSRTANKKALLSAFPSKRDGSYARSATLGKSKKHFSRTTVLEQLLYARFERTSNEKPSTRKAFGESKSRARAYYVTRSNRNSATRKEIALNVKASQAPKKCLSLCLKKAKSPNVREKYYQQFFYRFKTQVSLNDKHVKSFGCAPCKSSFQSKPRDYVGDDFLKQKLDTAVNNIAFNNWKRVLFSECKDAVLTNNFFFTCLASLYNQRSSTHPVKLMQLIRGKKTSLNLKERVVNLLGYAPFPVAGESDCKSSESQTFSRGQTFSKSHHSCATRYFKQGILGKIERHAQHASVVHMENRHDKHKQVLRYEPASTLQQSEKLYHAEQNFQSHRDLAYDTMLYRCNDLFRAARGTAIYIQPIRFIRDRQTVMSLLNQITVLLKKRVKWQRISSYLLKILEKNSRVSGVRFSCSGRLGGRSKKAQKAKKQSALFGKTSLSALSSKLLCGSVSVSTPYGKVGVKLWMTFKNNRC